MAYVGRKPANAALTATDITDGIITSVKLADDAVTTAKVTDVNITSGKIAADAITNAKTEFTPGLTIKGDGSSADGKIIQRFVGIMNINSLRSKIKKLLQT